MRWGGLLVATHPKVYVPAEDTFLLAKAAEEEVRPGDRFVEVGCGAGLVAMCAARAGGSVIALDRNPHAALLACQNARANSLPLQAIVGDMLAPIAQADVVAFNPPYLPTAPDEVLDGPINLAFDGGPDGNRSVLHFAAGLAALPAPRAVLVVHSSLSDPGPLDAAMAQTGFTMQIAAQQKLSWELLTVRRYGPP